MARLYAGILAPLAFLTAMARGILHAQPAEAALWTAWLCLLVFAALGCAAGWIAERIVDDSVRGRFAEIEKGRT